MTLNPARARKIEPMIRSLLQDLPVFSYEPEYATATAAVRAALAKRGTPIGPYDVMIAGTALRRGLVMVTSNGLAGPQFGAHPVRTNCANTNETNGIGEFALKDEVYASTDAVEP